ncbi:MAG: C39 family peptidase, partial [Lentisphaeria bacterium]|nr:C39 family peptidase [Lentisphaeria bacterium]
MKRVLSVFLALVLPCVLLGDKALSYEKNVKTNRRGEIYISGIPQVSQKRNFCAPACISMVVRYFDNKLNQKKLAKLFLTSGKMGTQSEEIVNAFSNEELAGFDVKRIYALSTEEYTRMMEMYNTASSGKRKRKKSKASATDNIVDSLNPEVARRVFPSVR